MTLLPVALSATLVLFFICACPTKHEKRGAKRRPSSFFRAVCRLFRPDPLDDTQPH